MMKPEYLLRQCLHLLDGLPRQIDPEIIKEIEGIRGEVRAMLLQCQNGNEQIAKAALEMTIGPRIDNLINRL